MTDTAKSTPPTDAPRAVDAPKPDAIIGADVRLSAYLKGRADDFAKLGWSDGGSIEIRGGCMLVAPDIDITLRRARAAEKARDQALAENEALRRALVDANRRNDAELPDPAPIVDATVLTQAQNDYSAALAAAGLKYPPKRPPANLLLTPEQWCRAYGVIVLDPDGWRGTTDGKPWDEPINIVEFYRRAVLGNSTCDLVNPAWEGIARDADAAEADNPAVPSTDPNGATP